MTPFNCRHLAPLALSLVVLAALCGSAGAAPAGPNKVKVGLFITQLYDLDMSRRSFSINFWAWFLHTDPTYKPLETVEIVNAKSTAIRFPSTTAKEDIKWQGETQKILWDQGKYAVTALQDWDVRNFPFDRQILHLQMEDGQNDSSQTILLADAENSKIDSSVFVPGWTIESFKIKARDTVYSTTYGDPSLQGSSAYSRITAAITLRRDGLRLLGSMFIGFFVAFALTCLTYFLDTDWMAGSRVGMCGGAIFASVGNKYVVDNYLPPVSDFTLADAIEVSTFVAIIFSILVVVLVKAIKGNQPILAEWINSAGFCINCFGYLAFNITLIARAAM